MDPPLSWTSMMWVFFCLRLRIFIWVCTMILMVVQNYFIWDSFLVQDLVKAFFLDWDL